jgi:hypothetical protein
MSFVELRPRCPSELVLDQLVVAELAADTTVVVKRHLTRCTSCNDRVQTIEAHRAAFSASMPPAPVVVSPWRRAAVGYGAAFAMAALLLLWLRVGDGTHDRDTVRVKGSGHHVQAFLVRDGATWQAEPGQAVHAGDVLQIVVEGDAYLAVVGTDASGRVSRYFPQGDVAERAAALPSIRFDATVGAEDIVIAFCDRALSIERALRECATETVRVTNRGPR